MRCVRKCVLQSKCTIRHPPHPHLPPSPPPPSPLQPLRAVNSSWNKGVGIYGLKPFPDETWGQSAPMGMLSGKGPSL